MGGTRVKRGHPTSRGPRSEAQACLPSYPPYLPPRQRESQVFAQPASVPMSPYFSEMVRYLPTYLSTYPRLGSIERLLPAAAVDYSASVVRIWSG